MDKVALLLETLDLEEVFQVLDITPYEVVSILRDKGLVELPPWLEEHEDQESDEA